MGKVLTIKIPGANTYYYSYYFYSTRGIRTPETPLASSTVGYYSTHSLLHNQIWLSSLSQTLTFRFYPIGGKDTFLDFQNELSVDKTNNEIVSMNLSAISRFDKLETPVFIGQHNPFIIEPDTQSYLLERYYIGNQVGISHEVTRTRNFFFEIHPKLLLPLDFEKEKDRIRRRNIPFGGYLNSNTR